MTKLCLESCPQIQMGNSIACENPGLTKSIVQRNTEYAEHCPGRLEIEIVDPLSLGKKVVDVICRSPELMQDRGYRQQVSRRIEDAYRKVIK